MVTRASVYEKLRPQHLLTPKDSLEMIPNLDEAHTGTWP